MSLLIRNLQCVIPLRRSPLRKNLQVARKCLKVEGFDVGVICTSDTKIRQLNRLYRRQDKATDVLSFPFHENLRPGLLPDPPFPDEHNLGDIYLGVEFIYQQCQETKEDFNNVLTVTAVHGLCHLLGYTHQDPEDWRKMFEKESEVLTEINRATGSALQPLSSDHFDQ
ncbi:endoribonuclease YbeY [Bufo bufo]|uniref:endoribonuclease YbeY n=1 Tax=Bufo bufo TaxID=8384 RepID=UPI001ABE4A25|nr:endoribonuclease YbeY [Bufo bufo]XP_040297113.1 endoribonuclease YbeY [Bufo bufo]